MGRTPIVISEEARKLIAEAPPLGPEQIRTLSRIFADGAERMRASHAEIQRKQQAGEHEAA